MPLVGSTTRGTGDEDGDWDAARAVAAAPLTAAAVTGVVAATGADIFGEPADVLLLEDMHDASE